MGWSIHHPRGLIYHDPKKAFPGYTLFASNGGQDAYLINMNGDVCHRWHWEAGLSYGFLLDSGNLLMRTQSSEGTSTAGPKETAIVELDWEGNQGWSYSHRLIHHDFVRLANGNTLMVFRDELPPEVAARVRGGRPNSAGGPMDGELIREIDVSGESVREWRLWENLDPETDVLCPLEPRRVWLRQNSLNVTRSGDLLVSFRQIDTVGIVDYATGKFVWKWGPGEISHQHHPTHLDNGNVLLFDNGTHRGTVTFSRVLEVDPTSDRIVWEYRGDPPISFYSFHISSAERLPNGNTFICEGAPGRFFEVTNEMEIVWEYVNPFPIDSSRVVLPASPTSAFRAHRYPVDHPAFQGKILAPAT